MPDDIVLTGSAAACSLGNDREQAWSRLVEGGSKFGDLTALESTPAVSTGGAQCPPLPSLDEGIPAELREAHYLRHVCLGALGDAGLTSAPGGRTIGLVVGSTLHGLRGAGRFIRTGDARHLAAVPASDTLRHALGDLPINGCRITLSSACASGLLSIGLAATLLRLGLCDIVLAGGYDPISEYAHAGFASLGLVTANSPAPFCKDRDGLKVAEGYGIVVMERSADAAARKAPIRGQLIGFGDSSDAHHLTQPHPEGAGATAAIRRALAAANLTPADLDMVVAHATGTPNNDAAEQAALAPILAAREHSLPVTAFKPALGHTLGAAGAVELIMTLCALRDGVIPHAANVDPERLEFPRLDLVCSTPRQASPRRSLNLSLGFGGSNAAAIVEAAATRSGQTEPARPSTRPTPREVLITGVGVITPAACDLAAFLAHRADGAAPTLPDQPCRVDPALYAHLINARRLRRIGECARLSIAACTQALQHAGVAGDPLWAESAIAVSATDAGSVEYSAAYYREIVEGGLTAANPMLFAEGVPNVAAAHMSMALGVRGGAFTVIGSRCAGLDAVRLAAARIQAGDTDRAIVCAAEEHNEIIDAAAGTPTTSAAAAVVLEAPVSADARRATPLARLVGGSWSHAATRPARPPAPDSLSAGPLLELIAAVAQAAASAECPVEVAATDCSGARTCILLSA